MKIHNREEWLRQAIEAVTPIFLAKGFVVPPCHVSCGFTSTGDKSGHIGQCWSTQSSEDKVNQIFISPVLSASFHVLDTLVHELVHAVDDCQHKHGKAFKKIALKIGMVGPMRSASAGPDLKIKLMQIATELGDYPHARLALSAKRVAYKPRPRARCKQCGFTVPMLKEFLHVGPPICPKDRIEMQALGEW